MLQYHKLIGATAFLENQTITRKKVGLAKVYNYYVCVIFNLAITLRAYLVLYIDVSMSTRIALAVLVQELGTGTIPRRVGGQKVHYWNTIGLPLLVQPNNKHFITSTVPAEYLLPPLHKMLAILRFFINGILYQFVAITGFQ